VVACDDGVMAQTREHLAILQLTGNPQLTVALTKADRVDEARISEVRETVQATLREYGFADAPLFVTVATEGRGIDELRHHCSFRRASTPAITASVWRSTGRLPLKVRVWW
jgi:selenocysteine-specific elongation factor